MITNPFHHLLTSLAAMYRAGRVSSNRLDAGSPRITIEFASNEARAAFLVSLAEVAEMLPVNSIRVNAAE